MEPRFNLWIEENGEVVLSRWRVRLLEEVQRTGSISAAAKEMQVPYRRAWERLHEMEKRLSLKLVETEVGGTGGGGACLTPAARDFVARFHQFAENLDSQILIRFQQAFSSAPLERRPG